MNDLPGTLELLSTRVEALEKRVQALEHPAETIAPATQAPLASSFAHKAEERPTEQAGGMFAVLGRAMLGIAGAFALRAVAESSSLPKLAIAGVAIVYAFAWLAWAARSAGAPVITRVVYAGTSSLILAPLLWELTLHFKVLSPDATATVLAAFVLAATLLAWKRDLAPVAWVAHGTAALTAFTLSIATHVMAPFVATLLLVVLICEYTKIRDGRQGIAPLAAGVADVGIWALIFIYSGPQNARIDFPPLGTAALLAPGCLLFLIGGVTVAIKTTLLRKAIGGFEALQAMIAFLTAVSSVLLLAPHFGSVLLGVASLVLAVACYTISLVQFRYAADRRNFNVFGTWSVGLLLAGAIWTLPTALAAACLGLLSASAVVYGVRMRCQMLEFHGTVLLVAASVVALLPQFSFHALAGSAPVKLSLNILLVSACATLCYAAGNEIPAEPWKQQVLHFVPALLASCGMVALMVQGMLALAARAVTLDVFHVAFIRTLAVCAIALAMAFGGSRWGRLEMTRLAYGALAFVAAKLIFEDLRHGRMEFIAGSIVLFALTLIAVPRLVRMTPKTRVRFSSVPTAEKRP